MEKRRIQIENMPFFERFEKNGRAIINTDLFEKWVQEVVAGNLKSKPNQKPRFERDRTKTITEQLNQVYKTESSAVDPVLNKMQLNSLKNGYGNETW